MGQYSAPGAVGSLASSIQALVQARGITPERILRQPRCKLALARFEAILAHCPPGRRRICDHKRDRRENRKGPVRSLKSTARRRVGKIVLGPVDL